MGSESFRSLDFTESFLDSYVRRDFSPADRKLFKKALRLLDENEQHPSLRVHQLRGQLSGVWSASASDELRVTFERLDDGRKRMLTASRHYKQ